MQTIVELPEFIRASLGLFSEDEKRSLINYLAAERNELAKLTSLLQKHYEVKK